VAARPRNRTTIQCPIDPPIMYWLGCARKNARKAVAAQREFPPQPSGDYARLRPFPRRLSHVMLNRWAHQRASECALVRGSWLPMVTTPLTRNGRSRASRCRSQSPVRRRTDGSWADSGVRRLRGLIQIVRVRPRTRFGGREAAGRRPSRAAQAACLNKAPPERRCS